MDFEKKKLKYDTLVRHKQDVIKNCLLLCDRLLDEDKTEFDFCKELVENCFNHDQSKWRGIQWQHLTSADEDDDMLEVAIKEHNHSNFHHPEAWSSGIKDMPDLFIAELTIDWFTRSNELGSDFFNWIDEKATKRFGFTKRDKVYKKIMKFANLLVSKM